ncbi:MAG: winged helix-turn-helix domain-containing protein [Dehalococcoidia bacterium]
MRQPVEEGTGGRILAPVKRLELTRWIFLALAGIVESALATDLSQLVLRTVPSGDADEEKEEPAWPTSYELVWRAGSDHGVELRRRAEILFDLDVRFADVSSGLQYTLGIVCRSAEPPPQADFDVETNALVGRLLRVAALALVCDLGARGQSLSALARLVLLDGEGKWQHCDFLTPKITGGFDVVASHPPVNAIRTAEAKDVAEWCFSNGVDVWPIEDSPPLKTRGRGGRFACLVVRSPQRIALVLSATRDSGPISEALGGTEAQLLRLFASLAGFLLFSDNHPLRLFSDVPSLPLDALVHREAMDVVDRAESHATTEKRFSQGVSRIRVDEAGQWVEWNDWPIEGLSPKEFALLRCLYRRKHQVCTYDELLKEVWDGQEASEALVHTTVRRLRRKLEPNPSNPIHIVGVRGLGYKLIPSVAL